MRFFVFLIALLCATPALAGVSVKSEVPYRLDAGLTKAEYFLATEKYTEALKEIAAVLKRHPKSSEAFAYRGYAYMKLGDEKKAADSFRKALAIDPTHLGAHKYIADMHLEEGELALAMEELQALRLICGAADCEEITVLESRINKLKHKKKKKEEDAGEDAAAE